MATVAELKELAIDWIAINFREYKFWFKCLYLENWQYL